MMSIEMMVWWDSTLECPGCGACTVMVSRLHRPEGRVEHLRWVSIPYSHLLTSSVNACLAPVVSMHGLAVTTVEVIPITFIKVLTISNSRA